MQELQDLEFLLTGLRQTDAIAKVAADVDWFQYADDPLRMAAVYWPRVKFYDRQIEILNSVRDNPETICRAGNMLGKDFASAFACLWGLLAHPVARVITTSVRDDHLRVLWSEIDRFVQTCKVPLRVEDGGSLICNHRDIRKAGCPISYLRGMVSEKGEGMAGHHAPYTLLVVDEASGVEDVVYTQGATWAKHMLAIGNPNPCQNFFRNATDGNGVRVLTIQATDSPNVRREQARQRGDNVSLWPDEIPGVLDWETYQRRLATWDDIRQCIGLRAQFYEGSEILLYPKEWLDRAEALALVLQSRSIRRDTHLGGLGVDPGEGGDPTSWCVTDRWGVVDLLSRKTPDTTVVPSVTLALMTQYRIPPERVCIDRGGGGKEHADYLRGKGYNVRTIAFGEAATTNPDDLSEAHEDRRELRTTYANRRAQMYGELRDLLNPYGDRSRILLNQPLPETDVASLAKYKGLEGFAIPREYRELRRQLSLMPLLYDREGRLYMLPKNVVGGRVDVPGGSGGRSRQKTLCQLLGRSPDDADACVLACHAMLHCPEEVVVGASW